MKINEFFGMFTNKGTLRGTALIFSFNTGDNDPAVLKARTVLRNYSDISDVHIIRPNLLITENIPQITHTILLAIQDYMNNELSQHGMIVNNIIMMQDVKGAIVFTSGSVQTFEPKASECKIDDEDNENEELYGDMMEFAKKVFGRKTHKRMMEEWKEKYSKNPLPDDEVYKHYY